MAGVARVEEYLASLPGGIDAYPECAHKGEPLSVWLDRSPARGLVERLPSKLARVLTARPPPAWVSEVSANALYLAIRDVHFPDDASFIAHSRACNRAVLDTPVNRVLFWGTSPKCILRAAGHRWAALHRGSFIDVRLPDDRSVEVLLRFPPRLFPEIVLLGSATGFAVAAENTGARDVAFELRDLDTTCAFFVGRWR
jgi:hypothetical protein